MVFKKFSASFEHDRVGSCNLETHYVSEFTLVALIILFKLLYTALTVACMSVYIVGGD